MSKNKINLLDQHDRKKQYSKAYSETLHYLKGIRKEDIEKIPQEFIQFLSSKADSEYKCSFDYYKPLRELNLLDETRGIIGMIC